MDAHPGPGIHKWSEQWIKVQERKRTYILGYKNGVSSGFKCEKRTYMLEYENGVSSGFKCEKGNGRTYWNTKME